MKTHLNETGQPALYYKKQAMHQGSWKQPLHQDAVRLDWIDALKGYAILGVVCMRCLMGENDVWFSQVFALGAKGVQLFFILSAFTLFLSFHSRKELSGTDFFIRRFFRIAPMYYLLIVFVLFQTYFQTGEHYAPWNIMSHFLLLHGLSPYWQNSLVAGGWAVGVGVLFYMMCPILYKYLTNINRAILFFIGTVVIGQMLHWYFQINPLISNIELWQLYIYCYFPTQLPLFAMGIVIYFILRLDQKTAFKKILVLLFGVFIFLILLFLLQKESELLLNMILSLALVPVFYILSRYSQTTFIRHIIVHPVVRLMGKLCFSMYLIHYYVIHWVEPYAGIFTSPAANYLFRLFVALVITITISYLTYQYIEQYFIRLGKRVIQRFTNSIVQ